MGRDHKTRLLALLNERAYMQGDVTLSAGGQSSFYIDGKMVEMNPEGAFLIGEVIYGAIKDLDVQAIGGLAVGAVPMVTSIVISCHHHEKPLEGFFVRDAAKSHGTRKVIEGLLHAGDRVVMVDDVITSGKSVLKAIEAAEERGAEIVKVVSIVDRDAGAAALFAERGYGYEFIFTKDEVARGVHERAVG
jgi:orotate phosphoribosyltransferase